MEVCILAKLISNEILTHKLKDFSLDDLNELSQEIREFLIDSISKTGGHIGPNLGVIELTVALHYVFDLEKDKLLFDVGHQGYTHKLLTGRKELFFSLNSIGGMSRFICPSESKYDILDASHGGTAVSIGTGMAYANKISNSDELIISVVGDGAFVEGMNFEALNYATQENLPLIIILNDNGMSIPQNVGSVNNILKNENTAFSFFNSMGFEYLYVKDGHNLEESIEIFSKAKKSVENSTVVVHVKTEKGKGLDIAKDHPYKLHFSMPFDPEDKSSTSPIPVGKAYTQIVSEELTDLLKDYSDIFAITPSTPYASGLDNLLNLYPNNVIDVGMAEQQAAGMAAGLAMKDKKVFLCYQSTFMQRAMDQIFHDICFMNLPVTIISSRSGFAGFDSPTHHAIYDLSYLRSLPNLDILYVGTSQDLRTIIKQRVKEATKPLLILHPYEVIRSDESEYLLQSGKVVDDLIFEGKDGYILTVGNRIQTAIPLRKELLKKGKNVGIINIKWINPLNVEFLLQKLKDVQFAITLEENVKKGGFGSSISEVITDNELSLKLLRVAIQSDYTKTGDKDYLSKIEKIDLESILVELKQRDII